MTSTVYTFTTATPDHGYCRSVAETLEIRPDGLPLLNGACVTRGKAADRLNRWRKWAATCPDQWITKQTREVSA
jgi:hypothetical protein